jgi:hypothetical protein
MNLKIIVVIRIFPKQYSPQSLADALYFNVHDIAQLHMMEQRDAVSQV